MCGRQVCDNAPSEDIFQHIKKTRKEMTNGDIRDGVGFHLETQISHSPILARNALTLRCAKAHS
jgi:hypothetical protein